MTTLAIFDMDGTILDTLDDLAASLNHALSLSGLPARTTDEVRRFIGNGVRKLVERGAGDGASPALLKTVYADFSAHYRLHNADHTRPYAGITELIDSLRRRGIKTAVVSNKADYAVQALCQRFFPALFDAAAGTRDNVAPKPAPDLVDSVLAELKTKRGSAVYIGDSEVDLETARNAGMPCIAVAWGFRGAEFLKAAGAETIVSQPREILDIMMPDSD